MISLKNTREIDIELEEVNTQKIENVWVKTILRYEQGAAVKTMTCNIGGDHRRFLKRTKIPKRQEGASIEDDGGRQTSTVGLSFGYNGCVLRTLVRAGRDGAAVKARMEPYVERPCPRREEVSRGKGGRRLGKKYHQFKDPSASGGGGSHRAVTNCTGSFAVGGRGKMR